MAAFQEKSMNEAFLRMMKHIAGQVDYLWSKHTTGDSSANIHHLDSRSNSSSQPHSLKQQQDIVSKPD